jgi:hypothetical protein
VLPVSEISSRDLQYLFNVELRYLDGMPPVATVEDAGELVGSGIGQLEGPRLRGTLRWSNFERTGAAYCQLSVAGEIETDDGALIRFESRGFALPQAARPWSVASAVRFAVEDPRYRWLQSVPAIWAGEFDVTAATARYRAYVAAESDP